MHSRRQRACVRLSWRHRAFASSVTAASGRQRCKSVRCCTGRVRAMVVCARTAWPCVQLASQSVTVVGLPVREGWGVRRRRSGRTCKVIGGAVIILTDGSPAVKNGKGFIMSGAQRGQLSISERRARITKRASSLEAVLTIPRSATPCQGVAIVHNELDAARLQLITPRVRTEHARQSATEGSFQVVVVPLDATSHLLTNWRTLPLL